jgi:hypothetical protein
VTLSRFDTFTRPIPALSTESVGRKSARRGRFAGDFTDHHHCVGYRLPSSKVRPKFDTPEQHAFNPSLPFSPSLRPRFFPGRCKRKANAPTVRPKPSVIAAFPLADSAKSPPLNLPAPFSIYLRTGNRTTGSAAGRRTLKSSGPLQLLFFCGNTPLRGYNHSPHR